MKMPLSKRVLIKKVSLTQIQKGLSHLLLAK